MDLWHAIVLGIVEGITEFLPISSTGHLMITSKLLDIPDTEFVRSFEVIIQFGAILSVVSLFLKRLLLDRATLIRVVAGFLPTALLGLLAYSFIKTYLLGNITVVLVALFLGGIVIILFERFHPDNGKKRVVDLTIKEAAMIGCIQTIAFVPGVSRAAATIFGGLLIGLSRKEAVEFSFFLAVPTMAAASGLDLIKNYQTILSGEYLLFLFFGFIVSFVTAFITIKFLIRYVSSHDFTAFGYYRIAIALLFFAVFFL